MGEVWKARDTRLGRVVAIKISKREFDDRFAREARASAALNHPNICSLYDVGADYLVMEYVDGKPVSQVRDLRKVLDIATQIADGLQAAHAAGFLHRDLKPDNILINREMRVKILDFGLVKDMAATTEPNERTVSVTASGVVVGTPAYMSPEQASGADLDIRSDQFSFGLVMYELISGKQPFRRGTMAETMAAIIRDDVDPLPAAVPAPLRWTIERCLSKSREQRYDSSRDLYEELRLMPGRLSSVTAPATASAKARRIPLLAWCSLSLAAGFLIAALLPAPFAGPGRATPFATEAEIQIMPSWAPNADRIAYTADVNGTFQIFTRQIRSSARTQITHQDASCSDPFWSLDGTRVYYTVNRSVGETSLWSVSVSGGKAEKVLDGISQASLSPDGKTLAVLQKEASGLYRLAFSSPPGAPPKPYPQEPVTKLRAIDSDSFLRFSKDGAYLGFFTDGGGRIGFWKIPMEAGGPSSSAPVEQRWKGPQPLSFTSPFDWSPGNSGIVGRFSRLGTDPLSMWDFQAGTQRSMNAGTAAEWPAFSPDGRVLAYATGSSGYDVIEVPLDGSVSRPVIATSRNEIAPSFDPDGTHFAYVTNRNGADEIWLRNRHDNSDRLVVGFGASRDQAPALLDTAISPDGRHVAYRRFYAGAIEIWIAPLSGEAPVPLWKDPASVPQRGASWSPDSNWIAYYSSRDGKAAVLKARIGANTRPELLAYTGLIKPVRWSPRGDWIAFDDTGGLRIVSPDGNRDVTLNPRHWATYGWSRDGAALYGITVEDNNRLMLARVDVETGRETKSADLGPVTPGMRLSGLGGNFEYRGFSLNPSGKTFLTSVYQGKLDLWLTEDFMMRTRLADWLWKKP